MLRLSGFELYSRWVPLFHAFYFFKYKDKVTTKINESP